MNVKQSRRGRSLKSMQMFELAEELGMTLEELVGPKRAVLYPRNMREVEFLRAIKKATPIQQAAVNALLGYFNDAEERRQHEQQIQTESEQTAKGSQCQSRHHL